MMMARCGCLRWWLLKTSSGSQCCNVEQLHNKNSPHGRFFHGVIYYSSGVTEQMEKKYICRVLGFFLKVALANWLSVCSVCISVIRGGFFYEGNLPWQSKNREIIMLFFSSLISKT